MRLTRRLAAVLAALMLALVPAACGNDDQSGDFPSNEGQETSQGGASEPKDPDPGPDAQSTGTQPGITQENP